ncbi:MAG: PBSX family phage terminase large subunit [Petrimonas sp.]|jgi:phage terminase large subunit
MIEGVDLTGVVNQITPIYFDKVIQNKKTLQIIYGGSSSGKSYAIAQRVVLDTLKGRNTLVVRKTSNSIKSSCFNEIVGKINDFNLYQYFKVSMSDFTITCVLNNKQILFKGLDDVEKIKSIKPLDGVLTDIWIEEATQSSYDDYKLLDKRLRGFSKFKKRITMSFNPILKTHWIYKHFFEGFWQDDKQYIENDTVSIFKTTYKDNLFLTKDDVERLEAETDPYYRNVYLMGNWGVLAGAVFSNYVVEDFDPEGFSVYRFGLDWGFSNDEFACVKLALDLPRRIIYICEEIYEKHLTNDQAIPKVKALVGSGVVWCDSAEPKSITEFRYKGINARPVKKGAGSVEQGVNFIKRFKIIIHPRCPNALAEFNAYRYKEDRKTGEVLPEIVDKDNHLIDAIRYALSTDFEMKGTIRDML